MSLDRTYSSGDRDSYRYDRYVLTSYFVAFVINDWIYLQGAYRSWKVMEFKIQIFQASKAVENKPNGCQISDPCTFFSAFTYIIIRAVEYTR